MIPNRVLLLPMAEGAGSAACASACLRVSCGNEVWKKGSESSSGLAISPALICCGPRPPVEPGGWVCWRAAGGLLAGAHVRHDRVVNDGRGMGQAIGGIQRLGEAMRGARP